MCSLVMRAVVYLIAFLTAIIFRKMEYVVALIHLGLILLLIAVSKVYIGGAVVFAVVLTVCLAVCVMYKMFAFSNTSFIIPVWIPVTWVLVGLFAHDAISVFSHVRL